MAQVDTSIYRNLQPTVKLQTPFELQGQFQQLQQGQKQNRLAEMQLQKAERDEAQQNALAGAYRDYYAQPTQDPNMLYKNLAGAGQGAAIPGVMKNMNDAAKSGSDAEKAKIETTLKLFDAMGRIMSGVKNQASYENAVQQAAQLLGPDKVANLPREYDPMFVQQKQAEALDAKTRLEQQWKAMEYTTPTANARLNAETSRANNAASLGVTIRGQDMTDARGRDTIAQGNKPPAGYRYTPDGNLETIPGGPADQKALAQGAAATDLDITLSGLRDSYDKLDKNFGIISTNNNTIANVGARIASSGMGQAIGKTFGTQNQSARNEIAMTRPALLSAIMRATGMSSKQLDSNAELKLWLTTATDPTLDVEANRKALDNIERKYLKNATPRNTKPVNAKTIKRTGTINGKKVVEYSDGSVEYANEAF